MAEVRSIQNFHLGPERNWFDIAYGFLVAPDSGRIYMGRGPNVWASHCPGQNHKPSVCIMGNFSNTDVPTACLNAIWWLADNYGLTILKPHRAGIPTDCPGNGTMRSIINVPRPRRVTAKPGTRPDSDTLRLVVNGRAWAGWDDAEGPLRWIAANGLVPTARAALAWRGSIWREPATINQVAPTLVNRFLGG
jgi:hypothetical protein